MLKFNSPDKTRANELKALFFIEKNLLADAEEILIGNLKSQTESPLTYDLLIGIYEKTRNYPLLISVLNS